MAVILYLLLVLSGLTCITSVSFEDATITDFFSFSRFHIKQASWACIALVTALCILLLESRYYHMYAYYAYAVGVLLITGTIILPEALAPTLNGAKAWYSFGSFVLSLRFISSQEVRTSRRFRCMSAGTQHVRSWSSIGRLHTISLFG